MPRRLVVASSPTRLTLDPDDACKCESRKMGFDTAEAAHSIVEKMMEQGHVERGCHLTPYECRDCGEWHIYNRVVVQLSRSGYPTRMWVRGKWVVLERPP